MKHTLKSILTKHPLLIKLEVEATHSQSAMLSLDDKNRFEITWHGKSKKGRVVSKYKNGYLSFYAAEGIDFAGVVPESTTVHPTAVISAPSRELVEEDTYDSLRISFNNIFYNIQYDHDKMHGIDIMELAGKEAVEINGLKFKVFLGSQSEYTAYPAQVHHQMDDLNFFFEGENRIIFAEVNKYIDAVTKVISLFIGRPIDPKSIEIGKKSDIHESIHDYALVEYSKEYEYRDLERDHSYGIETSEASNLIDAVCGALRLDTNSKLSQWFSFVEADEKKYYLDLIMANLLSCAESIYYLINMPDTTEREAEFDVFLKQIADLDIKPAKLKKFIRGAKSAYSDRVTYETKILALMSYSGVEVYDKQKIARYLNQLRNNIMHGTEPNWDAITDKQGNPIEPISPIQVLFTMKEVVSKSLIKYLLEN